MPTRRPRLTLLGVAATLLLSATYAHAQDAEKEYPTVKELPAAFRAAKADFRELTQDDVATAKADLLQALSQLDQKLRSEGANGDAWKVYVLWDKLQEQLRSEEGPEADVLLDIYKKYAADAEGLELAWFLDVKEALWRYRFMVAAVDNAEVKSSYEKLLEKLAELLESYAKEPTSQQALLIGQAAAQLRDARQASELLDAVQHHYTHPNFYIQVSDYVIASGLSDTMQETQPVRDYIQGTSIRGTARIAGRTYANLVPDEKRGVIDVSYLGIAVANNVGTNGPVRVYMTSTTRLGARKRLWGDEKGLHGLPAVANAVTKMDVTRIQASGRAYSIAQQRIAQQKPQTERTAARSAERQTTQRMDRQAAEMIDRQNGNYYKQIRQPLLDRNLFPRTLHFSTTAKALKIVGLQARRLQLGAPDAAPPELIENPDLAYRIHESAIANYVAGALGGRTIRDETFASVFGSLFGEVPERLQREEGQDPWAIGFAAREPLSFAFDDNGVVITLRGRKFQVADESHPGMNVTARYKFAKDEKGFKAVRQGELQIHPPGFVPGSGEKLSSREVIIRTLLQRRFGKIFEPEVRIDDAELNEPWDKAGPLRCVQLAAEGGWLTIAYRRIPK